MTTAYIGLGSNLGNRQGYIQKALALLAGIENVTVIQTSDIIETKPLGSKEQPENVKTALERFAKI